MDSQSKRINQPMTVVEPTYGLAERLVQIERDRGLSAYDAIREVARLARIGHGTLENILRKRVKNISGVVRDKITDALIAALQRQIEGLTNELSIVQCARRADPRSVAEIEADIAALRTKLNVLRGDASSTNPARGHRLDTVDVPPLRRVGGEVDGALHSDAGDDGMREVRHG